MSEQPTRSWRSPLWIGIFLVALVLDQATKQAALIYIPAYSAIEVTSFFNWVLVWNTVVSFGLFQNDGSGRWLLVGLALIIGCVIL